MPPLTSIDTNIVFPQETKTFLYIYTGFLLFGILIIVIVNGIMKSRE